MILILLFAAGGMTYRMIRPFLESETAAPAEQGADPSGERARLIRVVDGDTIKVRVAGRVERVRMLRINTPERGQPGFAAATASLEDLLEGRAIELQPERPGQPERDKYDRLLAYVLADGDNANLAQVRRGWSRFYARFGAGRLADEFRAAEDEARAAGRGLWETAE